MYVFKTTYIAVDLYCWPYHYKICQRLLSEVYWKFWPRHWGLKV